MRLAEIDANGVIVNVIEVDPAAVPDWAAALIDIGAAGGPGWKWDGETVLPPADPAPDRTTMQLTRRQVLIGLMSEGLITPAEAAGPAHVPPAAIEAVFAAMAEPAQSVARITWSNFTVAYRLDPMIPVIASAATPPLDDAALDAFFLAYAQA